MEGHTLGASAFAPPPAPCGVGEPRGEPRAPPRGERGVTAGFLLRQAPPPKGEAAQGKGSTVQCG